jgi:hypothetical protein
LLISFALLAQKPVPQPGPTGNIDITGTLDMGTNNLWLETPGSLSFSGSLMSSGGDITMIGNSINISSTGIINAPTGTINLTSPGSGNITPITDGAIIHHHRRR